MPLALLTFLISVAYLPIISAVSAPRWALFGVGGALLLLFTQVRSTAAHWAGAAFIAWCAATVLWSVQTADSAGALIHLVAAACVFSVAAEMRDMRPVWYALAGGAVANAIIALGQVNGLAVFDPTRLLAGSPIGLFGNKNLLANFGVLALLASLSFIGKPKTLLLVLGAAACALLPMSRGALLALAAGLLAFYGRRQYWALFVSIAWLSAAALLLDVYFNPSRMDSSVLARLSMWQWTVANLNLFGWGIGTYGSIFPFEHASSDALEISFETGIVGAAIFTAFLACVLVATSYARTERALIVAVLVESLFAFPLHQAATLFIFAIAAGSAVGQRARARAAEPNIRIYSEQRLEDAGVIGVGALHAVDLGRQAVPVGSRYANGRG